MKSRIILALVASGFLSGCANFHTQQMVVIGNSITLHAPEADVQWTGNWGMAASSQSSDFAHVAASTLGIPVQANNFADLERTPGAVPPSDIEAYGAMAVPGTIVVVELGDNVPAGTLAAFQPAYDALLSAVDHADRLVCLSTFWERPDYDALIKSECESHGGTYVFIGDIKTDPQNTDYIGAPLPNPFVQGHPHDWGMAAIAARIVAVLRPTKGAAA